MFYLILYLLIGFVGYHYICRKLGAKSIKETVLEEYNVHVRDSKYLTQEEKDQRLIEAHRSERSDRIKFCTIVTIFWPLIVFVVAWDKMSKLCDNNILKKYQQESK